MPLPTPATALNDACSVIFNNTLYVYTSDAFQSLELSKGAQWKTEQMGVSVTGGVCVGSTPADLSTAGFFVVGGTSSDSSFQGVQKFTYSTGSWESISFPENNHVAEQRLFHGATYINGSDSIFIYAGSQDGDTGDSTQTFTIGASAPYTVLSYSAGGNPPLKYPIVLPWSSTQAAVIGGDTANTAVWLFTTSSGTWTNSGATLAQGIPKDVNSVKAALMTGDDGSRSLYTFDSTVSPNEINRTILIDGSGNAVTNSAAITRRWAALEKQEEDSDRVVKRDSLTEANWPTYNSSLAPTSTRSKYALSTDDKGEVVITGGNTDDVLCVFNMRSNAWINATAMLSNTKLFAAASTSTASSSISSSTSASTTATSSNVASTTAAVASSSATVDASATTSSSSSSGSSTNAILAAVLGSIFGLAIILFFVYWCIRRQRARRVQHPDAEFQRSISAGSTEKHGMEFAGDTFPQPPTGGFRGHQQQDSHGSFSSMAILMGKIHQSKPSQSTIPKNMAMGSIKRTSTDSMFNKAFKDTISKPIPQAGEMLDAQTMDNSAYDKEVSFAPNKVEPRPRTNDAALDREGSTRRSSGWNRYWSGGSALNILGFGSGNQNVNGGTNGLHPGKRITVESDDSSYSDTHRVTQDSATVPPLNVYEPRASFSRVNSSSPTFAQYQPKVPMHQGMVGTIERPVSGISDTQSAYSSGIPASVHDAWDPTTGGGQDADWAANRARAASSFYSTSAYMTPLAPAVGSRPPTEMKPSGFPSGLSSQPQLAVAATSTDMSWLNLGNDKKK